MKIYTSTPRDIILSAITKLEEYIKVTYGAAGKGILIDNGLYQSVVDDGFIAVEEFELEDELENAVISYVKEATRKTNTKAGDATTTSILILCALIKKAFSNIEYSLDSDFNRMADELVKGLEVAVKKLRKDSKKVSTLEELEQIAFNAYRNKPMAKIVAETVLKVGADGIISVEDSDTTETTSNVVMGMNIDRGFINLQMGSQKVELKNPAIVITDEDLTKWSQIDFIIKSIGENGFTSMLIIADNISGEALNGLIRNGIIGIRATGFAEQRLEILMDIATVTKATVLSQKLGRPLSSFSIANCGSAKKVMIDIEETNIIDGAGSKEDIQKRVESIKPLMKIVSPNDKRKLEERVAKLTGGVAVIKVSSLTDTESRSIKTKLDDAIHATKLAYKEGKILGGGIALASVTSGSEILDIALKYPQRVLEENGKKYITKDVYDATGVVIVALESAVSVAASLITTGGIITNKIEKKDD